MSLFWVAELFSGIYVVQPLKKIKKTEMTFHMSLCHKNHLEAAFGLINNEGVRSISQKMRVGPSHPPPPSKAPTQLSPLHP